MSAAASADNIKGSVSRLSEHTYTTLYCRLESLALTQSEHTALQKELKVIFRSNVPEGTALPSPEALLNQVTAYKFANVRHPPALDIFGKFESKHSILRAPREGFFYTAVQTDTNGSYAFIIALLDFMGSTFVQVRWLTSLFPGSVSTSSPSAHGLAKRFTKLRITSNFAVVDISQIVKVVCVVPVFPSREFVWVNHLALGTSLRAYADPEEAQAQGLAAANSI